MKRLLAITLVSIFMFMPVVTAQGEQNFFNYYDITPHESVIEYIPGIVSGDELYINLTVQEGARAYVNIYTTDTPLPIYEFYGNNNVYGNLILNLSAEIGGNYAMYLFNDNEYPITIEGWWALNLNYTITTNTTTITGTETTTTFPTDTTATWPTDTTRPTEVPDYLGAFLDVLVRFVIPSLIVIVFVFILWTYCRSESFDYLTIFEEKEMVKEPDRTVKLEE